MKKRRDAELMLIGAALLAALGATVWQAQAVLGAGGLHHAPLALLACALCYLASHGVRAVRLAIVSGAMLGVSMRTAALVHLFIAPWSILLPFKLDEILRWRELARISRQAPGALIACLIDRTGDGIVLLALLYAFPDHGAGAAVMLALLWLAVGLAMLCFVLMPTMLDLVQRYLFEHHFGGSANAALAFVHHIRVELARGRHTIQRTWPWLLVCTLFAWLLELAAVGMFLAPGGRVDVAAMVTLLLDRAGHGAGALVALGQTGFASPEQGLTLVFLAVLALFWTLVALAYVRRWKGEPRRYPTGSG